MNSNRPTNEEPLTELEPVLLRYLDCTTTNWATNHSLGLRERNFRRVLFFSWRNMNRVFQFLWILINFNLCKNKLELYLIHPEINFFITLQYRIEIRNDWPFFWKAGALFILLKIILNESMNCQTILRDPFKMSSINKIASLALPAFINVVCWSWVSN